MEDKEKEPEVLDLEDSPDKQLQRFEHRSPDYSEERAELAKVETDLAKTVQTALMNKYDLDQIEKIIGIFNAQKDRIATEAFNQAMANFRAKMPQLKKDMYNQHYDSWYTSLGNLLETYNPPLGANGLSISFPAPEQDETKLTVECRVTHALGHHESVKLTAPIDTSPVSAQGKKARNPIQDIKSTFTYLRSATCEAVLGVSGTEASVSDDGNLAGKAVGNFINEDQVKKINEMMDKSKINKVAFIKSLKVQSIEQLPAAKFKSAMATLEARSKQTEKKPAPAKKPAAKKQAAKKPAPQREPGSDDE